MRSRACPEAPALLPPSSVNLLLCPLLLPAPREDVPPPDNESMPSHGWFLACCNRQHHIPLPDSLQLELTLSDSLSLSFQDSFPCPHTALHPCLPAPFLLSGESAELGSSKPRPQALLPTEETKTAHRGARAHGTAHRGAPGTWLGANSPCL